MLKMFFYKYEKKRRLFFIYIDRSESLNVFIFRILNYSINENKYKDVAQWQLRWSDNDDRQTIDDVTDPSAVLIGIRSQFRLRK